MQWSTRLAICALLVTTAAAADVRAQAGPDEADRLFQEGRSALRQGDFATACAKLSESQRLDPAPGTLLNLSECEEGLGKLADAWRHIQQTISQLPEGDDRLPIAKQRAAILEKRIPRIRVSLGAGVPASTRLTLDAVKIDPGEQALVVDPGEHVVVVLIPGERPRSIRVLVAEGQTKELMVERMTAPAASTALRPAPPPRSAPNAAIGWTLVGVGAAGLVLAGVTGALMAGKQGVVDSHCDAARTCDDRGYSAVRDGRQLQPWYLAGWIAGAIGVTSGSVLILTAPRGPSLGFSPQPRTWSAGLSLSGRFE